MYDWKKIIEEYESNQFVPFQHSNLPIFELTEDITEEKYNLIITKITNHYGKFQSYSSGSNTPSCGPTSL